MNNYTPLTVSLFCSVTATLPASISLQPASVSSSSLLFVCELCISCPVSFYFMGVGLLWMY